MKAFRKIIAPLVVLLFMCNGGCTSAKKTSSKSKEWASARGHSPHEKTKLKYKYKFYSTGI
ncbi:MAG: hypothetical protein ACXVNO_06820 [Bacteroidia bacterium]